MKNSEGHDVRVGMKGAESGRGGQPEGVPDTYLCPPSMDRRSAVEGVLILALSFRSIVKHSSLTASFWTVSASLATWQKAMARWETGSSYSEGSSRLIMSSWVSSDISFNASVTETPQIGAAQGEAGLKAKGSWFGVRPKAIWRCALKVRKGTVVSSWTNCLVLTLAGWRYLCLLRQT